MNKIKFVKNVLSGTYLLLATGVFLWMIYEFYKGDSGRPAIVAVVAFAIFAFIILLPKIRKSNAPVV